MSGDLEILVKNCTGLSDEDGIGGGKSDPYVYFTIEGCDAQQTSTKENTQEPEWNETITFEGIEKPGTKVLRVRVYDDDTFGDDKVGEATIDLGELINQEDPQDFELEVDRRWGGLLGKAVLNLSLTTKGWGNPPGGAGDLVVLVKSCTGLDDADGIGGGASDAYVYLSIDGEESQKTSVKGDTLNPVWDEELTFAGLDKPCSKVLKVSVWDDDVLSDDKLGEAEIDLGGLVTSADPQDFSLVVDRKLGGLLGKATLELSVTTGGWGGVPA